MEDFCDLFARRVTSHVPSPAGSPEINPILDAPSVDDDTRRRVRSLRRDAGPFSHWSAGKSWPPARCCVLSFSYFSSSSALDTPSCRLSPSWRRRYGVRRYREYNIHPVRSGGCYGMQRVPALYSILYISIYIYIWATILIAFSILSSREWVELK